MKPDPPGAAARHQDCHRSPRGSNEQPGRGSLHEHVHLSLVPKEGNMRQGQIQAQRPGLGLLPLARAASGRAGAKGSGGSRAMRGPHRRGPGPGRLHSQTGWAAPPAEVHQGTPLLEASFSMSIRWGPWWEPPKGDSVGCRGHTAKSRHDWWDARAPQRRAVSTIPQGAPGVRLCLVTGHWRNVSGGGDVEGTCQPSVNLSSDVLETQLKGQDMGRRRLQAWQTG